VAKGKSILMASKPPDIKENSKFNINAFRSEILNKGVMRPQYFHVDIGVPEYLQKAYNDITSISLRCESTALPGIDLSDGYSGIPRAGYGVKEYIPYNVEHKVINFTFLLDQGTYVQDFFLRWMSSIVNFNNPGGGTLNTKISHGYNNVTFNAYEVGYKDSYCSPAVSIYTYNPQGEQTISVKLYRAFPISLTEVPLTWNDTDQIGRLTVPMTFKDFEYQTKLTTA
jgi:hypothetical protein